MCIFLRFDKNILRFEQFYSTYRGTFVNILKYIRCLLSEFMSFELRNSEMLIFFVRKK